MTCTVLGCPAGISAAKAVVPGRVLFCQEIALPASCGIQRDFFVSVNAVGVEAEADWDNLRSPETYLGYARDGHKAPLEHLRLNQWGLAGEWTSGAEKVTLERANGSIAFRFHARDAHLVLFRNASDPIPFRLLLEGNAPGHAHGIDVDEDGRGVLDEGRLYQLVRQRESVRERTLEITFLERGAEAYVFTFGETMAADDTNTAAPPPPMRSDRGRGSDLSAREKLDLRPAENGSSLANPKGSQDSSQEDEQLRVVLSEGLGCASRPTPRVRERPVRSVTLAPGCRR